MLTNKTNKQRNNQKANKERKNRRGKYTNVFIGSPLQPSN